MEVGYEGRQWEHGEWIDEFGVAEVGWVIVGEGDVAGSGPGWVLRIRDDF